MGLVGWSGPLPRTYLYISCCQRSPQSEVTPFTVSVNARSKITRRLGGALWRGATFGAPAHVRAGTFGGRRKLISNRGLVVVVVAVVVEKGDAHIVTAAQGVRGRHARRVDVVLEADLVAPPRVSQG